MDILSKHTADFFGAKTTVQRSGKVLYKAGKIRRDSERLGVYRDGKKQRSSVNYSSVRKSDLGLAERIFNR